MSRWGPENLTWNKKGVERMEYFMAEQIAYHIFEVLEVEPNGEEDSLIDKLRCVQGERIDGKEMPNYLRMSVAVAGNVMGNMMAQELMQILLPPDMIAGIAEGAIERAVRDEEYDREYKDPEDYEISEADAHPNCGRYSANSINRSSRIARPLSISVTIGSSSRA